MIIRNENWESKHSKHSNRVSEYSSDLNIRRQDRMHTLGNRPGMGQRWRQDQNKCTRQCKQKVHGGNSKQNINSVLVMLRIMLRLRGGIHAICTRTAGTCVALLLYVWDVLKRISAVCTAGVRKRGSLVGGERAEKEVETQPHHNTERFSPQAHWFIPAQRKSMKKSSIQKWHPVSLLLSALAKKLVIVTITSIAMEISWRLFWDWGFVKNRGWTQNRSSSWSLTATALPGWMVHDSVLF